MVDFKKELPEDYRIKEEDYLVSVNGKAEGKQQKKLGEDKELLRITLLNGKDQGRRIPTRQWGEGTL